MKSGAGTIDLRRTLRGDGDAGNWAHAIKAALPKKTLPREHFFVNFLV